jgi:hypothetical protein
MSSIAAADKRAMDLEHLRSLKKKQLTEDYNNLLKGVKENPYLHFAIAEYKMVLDDEQQKKNQQIKALNVLLNYIDRNNVTDRNEIKREIQRIKENK